MTQEKPELKPDMPAPARAAEKMPELEWDTMTVWRRKDGTLGVCPAPAPDIAKLADVADCADFTRAIPPCDDARGLELFPDKHGNGGFIQDLCYTVWEKCQYPTHPDGKTDWFNDTLPIVQAGLQKIGAALRPAPISVEAVEGMKRKFAADNSYHDDMAVRNWNDALDAIIAKLKGE